METRVRPGLFALMLFACSPAGLTDQVVIDDTPELSLEFLEFLEAFAQEDGAIIDPALLEQTDVERSEPNDE